MTSIRPNKEIVEIFFTREGSAGKWRCSCGILRAQGGSGFSNLLSHLSSAHPKELADQRRQGLATSQHGSLRRLLYPPKTVRVHGWLSYIVHGLQPFSACENKNVTPHMRYERLSVTSLMKYLMKITVCVEKKIARLLPNKFALVFDGWSGGETHYVSVFASIPADTPIGYRNVLLAMSPLENEDTQSTDEHYNFIEFVLSVFGKCWNNVVALCGDNCATNKALSRKAGCGFVGCGSHRFNLAVKDMLECHADLLSNIRGLMQKLRTPTIAARLRRKTFLKAKLSNETRWSSSFEMLRRYSEIKAFVSDLHDPVVDELLPNTAQDRKIESLLSILSDLNVVTVELQKESLTMSTIRAIFDTVIEDFPMSENRLSESAGIVLHPDFERGVTKVQENRIGELTIAESSAIQCLKIEMGEESESSSPPLTILERAAKRVRMSTTCAVQIYSDTRFIVPTSNVCERFFSTAGHALSDRRKSILPSNFEAQLFLNFNWSLWGIEDVNGVINE